MRPLHGAAPAAFLLASFALAASPTTSRAQDEWDAALRSMPRLPPSAFTELPAAVVAALEDLGCTVPQTYFPATAQNAIAGRFDATGEEQWAVLCSVADTSEIVVLDADGGELHRLERSPDRQWLQGIGGGRIGFSRLLRTIARDEILSRTAGVGGELPSIEHDGIEEIFTEKASTVWYWHDGAWVALPGLD